MEVMMARKRTRAHRESLTAIRLSIPSELWRKFRAGCLYMDKDANDELNRLLEGWVKEWHKRILKPEHVQGEESIEHPSIEQNPSGFHGGPYSPPDDSSSTT